MALATVAAAFLLAACDRPRSEETAEKDAPETFPIVTQTAPIKVAERATELSGIATIVDPAPLLQIDADIAAADIAAEFSSGTLERFKATKSLSRQTIEAAVKQAATDATQQKLLELRLKQTWGENAPFLDGAQRKQVVAELSEGKRAIVRMDFPDLTGGAPKSVRVTPLSGGQPTPVADLWIAPSGSLSMPGVSYYGLINSGPGLRAGDRARLTAEAADTREGLIIPSSALVVTEGQTWCYVETAPETYEKRPVPLDHPYEDGYLVTEGFKAGEKIVVRGASLLLAREAEPGDFDDDDAPAKPQSRKPPAAAPGPAGDDDDDSGPKPAPPKTGAQNGVFENRDGAAPAEAQSATGASPESKASLAESAEAKRRSAVDRN